MSISAQEQAHVENMPRREIFRTTAAGTLGTTLEYYDYVIYSLATALIFNRLFFTNLDPAMGLVAGFATYAVGFAVRPLGGLIFGAIGDRVGRKFIMMFTMIAMGVATFAIGLLPVYEQVGVLAPILLLLCRMVQGMAAGAELASASSLMVESAHAKQRGFVGSFVSMGTNCGSLLASAVWLTVSAMPHEVFISWGWRLPFLASILLTVVGLWIRLHVKESNVFMEVSDRQRSLRMRDIYRNLLKNGWRSLLVSIGMRIGEGGTSTIYQVFLVGYVSKMPGVGESAGPTALLISAIIGLVSIPLIGTASDKFGRRRIFLILAGIQVLFAFPALILISTGNMFAIVLAFVVASAICVQGMYAVEAAFMCEMFGSRHRLLGVSASKELGGLLGAGFAPMIVALFLAATGHWWVIAAYTAFLALIGFVAGLFAPEVAGRDLVVREDALPSGEDRKVAVMK
jgi:MFS transporter, MHS family, metabolite:H+ symporter